MNIRLILVVCVFVTVEVRCIMVSGPQTQWRLPEGNQAISNQEEMILPTVSAADRKRSARPEAGGLGAFSVGLYRESNVASSASNIVISPVSVATALAMTWEGAKGNTATQIERALQIQTQPGQNRGIGQWFKSTLHSIQRRNPRYAVIVGNRAFIQDSFKILPSYKKSLKTNYDADVNLVNFMNPQLSSTVINDWVSSTTKGHITQAVSPADIDELTQMILVNVLYFKGEWQVMFDPAHTRETNFYLSPHKFVRVPMMKVHAEFRHADFQELGFQMLEMPYKDGDVSMFMILPDDPTLFNRIQEAIISQPNIIFNPDLYLSPTNITVHIPKFSLRNTIPMKGVLQRLDVKDMFMDGMADLSGVTGNGALAVGNVIHEVRLDVDEQGATASASTAVVYRGRSAFMDSAFHANKPFIFFIRDNKSKLIFFMGHVKNPTETTS